MGKDAGGQGDMLIRRLRRGSEVRPQNRGNEWAVSPGRTSLRTVAAIALTFITTVFVLQNTEVVDITFLFWRLSLSKVILLLAALALGCALGLLMGRGVFGRKKKRAVRAPAYREEGPRGPSMPYPPDEGQ